MAGGFTVKKSHYRLRFEDPELADCVVKVRAMSIAEMMDMIDDFDGEVVFDGTITPIMAARLARLFEWFLDFTLEWNLEDEEAKEPIERSVEGMRSMELPFAMALVTTWLSCTAGVAPGLRGGSNSGEPFPEASLPMEVSSGNQGS